MWCGEGPLWNEYPRLYEVAANKEAWISKYIRRNNAKVNWEAVFIRIFHDWELKEVIFSR